MHMNVYKVLWADWRVFLSALICHCWWMTAAICVPQSVRKTFALSAVSGMFKSSPRALRDLLRQDYRVSLRFTASLLGIGRHTLCSCQ